MKSTGIIALNLAFIRVVPGLAFTLPLFTLMVVALDLALIQVAFDRPLVRWTSSRCVLSASTHNQADVAEQPNPT